MIAKFGNFHKLALGALQQSYLTTNINILHGENSSNFNCMYCPRPNEGILSI